MHGHPPGMDSYRCGGFQYLLTHLAQASALACDAETARPDAR